MYRALEKSLRNELEAAVKKARDIAEAAAKSALEQLGVGEATLPLHLSESEKDLRRRLRAHGRQLGDVRNEKTKTQELTRLTEEVAYEHWHRMLFARFLAENDLLMYPDPDDPVAITLEECESLAKEEGASNGWELAAKFAAKMLPQIFRIDSPVFELTLPPENQRQLEKIVAVLDRETFLASDALGWVYQFWQAKRKEEVNKAEIPIGARELPAVTQLFTEDYMVSFLLDNSLGAWWAARRLTEDELMNAESEEELRQKASIEGVPLEYLRFVKNEDGKWEPASGTFDEWPEKLSELKVLDPSCGSGHFLVAAFLMLVPMRMEIEGLPAPKAVDAVLEFNIHGLEIEQRCIELAAFALALNAWHFDGANGYRKLPELNLACSGLSINIPKEEWNYLTGKSKNLRLALENIYENFRNAPLLGSLINPTRSIASRLVQSNEFDILLNQALSYDKTDEKFEFGIVVKGIGKAARLLSGKYHWIITNVPYLGKGSQDEIMKSFAKMYYPDSDNDLAMIFLSRILELLEENSISSLVIPLTLLTSSAYKKLRTRILKNTQIPLIGVLGARAFQTIGGEVVKVILINLKLSYPTTQTKIHGLDVSALKNITLKRNSLISAPLLNVNQEAQFDNPNHIISLYNLDRSVPAVSKYGKVYQGLSTGDDGKYVRNIWEFLNAEKKWKRFISNTDVPMYSGMTNLLDWANNDCELANSNSARIQGLISWGKRGLLLSSGKLVATIYPGEAYNKVLATFIPVQEKSLLPLYTFFNSQEFVREVRKVDKNILVTPGVFANIPIDYEYWCAESKRKYPNGLPKPFSTNPTQWIYHGHPCGSVIWDEETKWTAQGKLRTDDTVLQVAVARLLGYRWPSELDKGMELADEQREWVNRCEELLPFSDEDGIVCIPAVRGEPTAADRLLNILAASYGDRWGNAVLDELLTNAGHTGKTLDSWLREKFFTQHCKLFQHRPFIWHIWDGLPDGFGALVNYHKLDAKLLETLIYTYLGDWITRQREDLNSGIDGAAEKLAAAELLKKSLQLILEGEAPYDIFVRWKPLEEQPIGWNPDLNDGVRLNIRPFMNAPDVRKKGAGVLRDKPNIKWNKDRGTDVPSAPWYKLGLEYGGKEGDRINDHHLKLSEKVSARKQREGK